MTPVLYTPIDIGTGFDIDGVNITSIRHYCVLLLCALACLSYRSVPSGTLVLFTLCRAIWAQCVVDGE